MQTRTMTRYIALATLGGLSFAAQGAEPLRQHYQAEVERCAAALQAGLDRSEGQAYRLDFVTVDKTPGWYVFTVETVALDGQGRATGPSRTSRCAGHRWTEETVLEQDRTSRSLTRLVRDARASSPDQRQAGR